MHKVSVIVPNHGRDLTILSDSIKNSSVKGIDLVIVDMGKERSFQRNLGLSKAKGQYLLFLDSDQSVHPCLIKECLKLMEEGFSALYIPEIIVAKSFFGRIRAFERTFYDGTAIDVPRFIRKSICPKFDESMSGPEDADFSQRLSGYRTITKNPLYHHDDISLAEYCRKKAYYTKSMRAYIKKWPDDLCISLKYRCWTVFTEKGKWKRLFAHPILTLGIVFLLALRGVIFYVYK